MYNIFKGDIILKLAIVTTTYNRKKLLKRLYTSLNKQNDRSFTWIVIDDGSTDDTSLYINNLAPFFKIRYFYKENAGKAKALNYAFEHNPDIDLYIIVDSDDYLLNNAIMTIREAALKYYENNKIGALFFKYQYKNGEILGENKKTYNKPVILSRLEHDAKFVKIDGCICYFNKAVQKYKYPEFDNENYVGPTVIQMRMENEYKIAFLNDVIGVAEYQEGGLTDSGRKIRIKNPKSMMIYSHYMQDKRFNFRTKIKYGIMANAYNYIDNKNNRNENRDLINKIKIPKKFRIIGTFLGMYWLKKYKID